MPNAQQKNYCRLYLVRHGESEGNVLGVIQGHADFPLTERGKQQAAQLASDLEGVEFAAVFASDLVRASQTAAVVASNRKLAVTTTALLRERSFGKYEKELSVESQRELRELLQQHEAVATKELFHKKLGSDIESDEEVVGRFINFLREVAVAYAASNILVVSHSGMLKSLLIHLGYATYQELKHGSIPNASYIVIESDGVDFFIQETVGIIKTPVENI